ncbi:hypothetical protein SOASR032_08750 [Pragia fontium]|uniref:Uncharacterized protein n=1 Tax=Pragia fontium TaxID=82985 RepID=A0ABQ5LH57_9GAMM|nr:hypothetical protein SOASR032_08750 [Pragia fontium]
MVVNGIENRSSDMKYPDKFMLLLVIIANKSSDISDKLKRAIYIYSSTVNIQLYTTVDNS